ncbi:MAG: right-handed parallel beta-helix repeat-containing protein, partial [Lentisphaeria bacterium]|nr:right-handed parallel beta-helix repeat-containing protein [Lentisphaeria bacterium]
IGKSSYNKVTHNEISNFDYSGISCGWSWGFRPSTAHHNNLDYNHIHHLSNGEGLSDMGGIYTLGVSPGTTERYNHMHDIYSYAHVSHGSGIYPDEGSSEILIENNVVHRIRTCPLFMHYGRECTVRNNILAFGGAGQLRRCREDKRCHYNAEGNIVYGDTEKMLVGPWKNGDWKIGRNVYWSTAGEPTFADMDFATWQTKGKDVGSIVADPLFMDPEAGDFRLKPNSPALKLGFKPIDLSKTGLYGDAFWVNLPRQYKNRVLNDIPAPARQRMIINFDFESEERGGQPLDGKIITGKKGSSLTVSADTAATGTQSLKFVDAPGQTQSWMPHVYYHPTSSTGKIQVSWDMLNSKEEPASFYVEVRDYDNATPYVVGPTMTVFPDGKITAGEQDLGTIPLGEWVHVDLSLELGEGAAKTYRLTLSVPGREPMVADLSYMSDKFEKVTWLGIASTSDTRTEFYIDNLKLGTAEELAQAPKRRRKSRVRKEKPRKPANNQMLAGHWTFNETDGYTATDSSGCANDGDVWANWAKGKFGTAIYCDPLANRVIVPDDPTLHFGTSDFSIELWICPTHLQFDGSDARRRFLSKNNYPKTWLVMDITPDGRPALEMADANQVNFKNKSTGTIPENAWTHLVVVVDRINAKTSYYFNGKLDSAQDIPAAFTGAMDVGGGDLTIGSSWHPFIGLLDEVKIHKRTLSAAEIKASYEKEKGNRASAEYELVE